MADPHDGNSVTDTTAGIRTRLGQPLVRAVLALVAAAAVVGVVLVTVDTEPPESGPVIGIGRSCFETDDEQVAELVVIDVVDEVTAEAIGRIPAEDAFPPLVEEVELVFEGRTDATADVVTTTADGATTSREEWTVGIDRLERDVADYRRIECADIAERIGPVFDPGSLEIDTDEELVIDPERGAATASSEVLQEQLDRFSVSVSAGDELTARITSIDDNAALRIIGPGRVPLAGPGEAVTTIVAPVDGSYDVMVGSVDGLASYGLAVEVAPVAE